MKNRNLITAVLFILLALPTLALAKPAVEVSMIVEKELVVVEDGKEVTKMVTAEEIIPSEVLFYTITFTNNGDEAATNAVINNPVPEGTAYLPNTASDEAGNVSFSIDGGQTYKKPTLLTYEVTLPDGSKEQRTASPEQYTHIRWQVEKIEVGQTGKISFQVRVK